MTRKKMSTTINNEFELESECVYRLTERMTSKA